jgi:hypothetical protein
VNSGTSIIVVPNFCFAKYPLPSSGCVIVNYFAVVANKKYRLSTGRCVATVFCLFRALRKYFSLSLY